MYFSIYPLYILFHLHPQPRPPTITTLLFVSMSSFLFCSIPPPLTSQSCQPALYLWVCLYFASYSLLRKCLPNTQDWISIRLSVSLSPSKTVVTLETWLVETAAQLHRPFSCRHPLCCGTAEVPIFDSKIMKRYILKIKI